MSWQGVDDFLRRISDRLIEPEESRDLPITGEFGDDAEGRTFRDAGVLFGIVDRGDDDLHIILTERPKSMPTHAGQVALPGGKVDRTDAGPVAAAIREAEEEIGLNPDHVEIIGKSDLYLTRTGFSITPVIGLIPSDFEARPDPHEVDDVFETPLSFLMNPANHHEKTAFWNGAERSYLEMPHNGRYIWGVTAGMIRALYERLYLGDDEI